jgi:hypothetical protein
METDDDVVLVLIRKAIDPATSDDELAEILEELNRRLSHPAISDLIFHHEPELSAEEVLEIARAYRPVITKLYRE